VRYGKKWAAKELTKGESNAAEFLLFFFLFSFPVFFCASYTHVRDAKRLSIIYYVMYDGESDGREACRCPSSLRRRPDRASYAVFSVAPRRPWQGGRLFLRLFFFSIGPGRVSSRGTRKNAARSVSVRQSGGTPLVMTAGCGRRLIGSRRKNLFREKLASSGQSTCSRDLPLLSHFSQTCARICTTILRYIGGCTIKAAVKMSSVAQSALHFLAHLPALWYSAAQTHHIGARALVQFSWFATSSAMGSWWKRNELSELRIFWLV